MKNYSTHRLFWALILAAVQTAGAIELKDLPSTVRMSVVRQAGDSKIDSISIDEEQGQTFYSVVTTVKKGKTLDFTVDQEGQLVLEEINADDVPPPVKKTMKEQAGSANVIKVEKSFDLGAYEYEVTTVDKAGREGGFTIEPDGTLSSVQVQLGEISLAVQNAISTQLSGRKIESIEKMIDGNSFEFDVEVIDAKGRWEKFTVSAAGNLESVSISFEELAPPVKKAIREHLGSGKIRELLKMMPGGPKGSPIEVYGVKNGKPFNFRVGPAGKFISMLE